MIIIRYTHFNLGPGNPSETNKILFSSSPFLNHRDPCFTDNIRTTLSNGFFVCGHEKATPGFCITSKANGIYFHWCRSGKGIYNGKPFKKNDVFVVHPGTEKSMIADADDPWEIYWCVWKGDIRQTVAGKLNRYDDSKVYTLGNHIDLSGLFDFLIYQPHRESRIEKIISGFVDILLGDSHISPKEPSDRSYKRKKETVVEIKNYINDCYRTVTVESLAGHFHYNRKYITELFHGFTGITLSDYIRDVRLSAAESHLLTSQLSVEKIALMSGYANYSTFIKAFKKKNGVTPSEFIRYFSS